MHIRFQDSFRDICKDNFSIAEEEVSQVALNPESKSVVKAGNASRIYLFGRPPGKQYSLLVEGQWSAPYLNVIAAFKVLPEMLNGKDNEPVAVLRSLATSFGVPLKVGDFQATFIASRSFELRSKDDRTLKILTNKGGHFAQTMHSSFRHEGDRTFLDVSLAYCLDVDKMADYLNSK